MCVVWGRSQSLFIPYEYPAVLASFVVKTLISSWISLVPLWKIKWSHACRSISRLSVLFHWHFVNHYAHINLSCNFIEGWHQIVFVLNLILLFKIAFAILGHFHIHFKIGLSISTMSLLELWLGLCWFYRSFWGELASKQYWIA